MNRRLLRVAFLATLALMFLATGHQLTNAADDTPLLVDSSSDLSFDLIGRLSGHIVTVIVKGSYAYIGEESYDQVGYLINTALTVVDISNPALPTRLGSLSLGSQGHIIDLQIVDNRAYIAQFAATLHIVDVSDPVHLTYLGHYDPPPPTCSGGFPPAANRLQVTGSVAFLSLSFVCGFVYYAGRTDIVDVSNPANPTLLGHDYMEGVGPYSDMRVVDGYAYLSGIPGRASYGAGMSIYDVTNPTNAKILTNYGGGEWAVHAIAVAADTVYMVGSRFPPDQGISLEAVDVTNHTTPILRGNLTGISDAGRMQVANGRLYAIGSALQVFDVHDPTNIQRIGFLDVAGWNLSVSGGLIYVATSNDLLIFRASPAMETWQLTPGGGTFTTTAGDLSLTFPPDAVTSTVTISYTHPTDVRGSWDAQHVSARQFTLEAYTWSGSRVSQFSAPYTLTLTYPPNQLTWLSIAGENLNLAFKNDTTWTELLPCQGCSFNPDNHQVVVILDQFSQFVLIAEQRWVHLPWVQN